MGFLKHILGKHIVCVSVLLALLSFTKYFLQWKSNIEETNRNLSRTPFYIAHVLDPSVDGLRYTSWSRQDWLNWLIRREARHQQVNRYSGRTPLPDKGLNSVIITTPAALQNAFEDRHPYNARDSRDEAGTFWANTLFSVYVFQRDNHGRLNVFRCPPMYVALKLRDGVPVHFHQQSMLKDATTKANLKKDCSKVDDLR